MLPANQKYDPMIAKTPTNNLIKRSAVPSFVFIVHSVII